MERFFRVFLCTSFVAFSTMVGFGIGTAVADSNHKKEGAMKEKAAAVPALMTAAASKAHAANNEGIEHYNQEHWGVALGHFKKAVEADPASAEAHYNLALALDKSDQHKAAAMEFKQAQDLGKDNPDIQNSKILLGHVKMLKGDM